MIAENIHLEEILKAIKKGDRKAFEQLFKEWYVRLCVYAESIVRERDQAEDLVQNVFCTLWEKREEMEIHNSVKVYLYRSVYYSALNILKHEKVKLAFFEFLQKQAYKEENVFDTYWSIENQEILLKEVYRAIETLPEQCREIFILSRLGGKKSQEIAATMNLSVRTVETQLYRAMKRLREELAHLKNSEILLLVFFSKNCK